MAEDVLSTPPKGETACVVPVPVRLAPAIVCAVMTLNLADASTSVSPPAPQATWTSPKPATDSAARTSSTPSRRNQHCVGSKPGHSEEIGTVDAVSAEHMIAGDDGPAGCHPHRKFPVSDQFLLAEAGSVKIAGADGAVVVEIKNLQEQAARVVYLGYGGEQT